MIKAKFLYQGGEGEFTKLFENLSPDDKIAVMSAFDFDTDTPVVVCKNESNLIVISDEHLYIYIQQGHRVAIIPHGTIEKVSYHVNFKAYPGKSPQDFDLLELITKSMHITITIEKGKAFTSFYQALMLFV